MDAGINPDGDHEFGEWTPCLLPLPHTPELDAPVRYESNRACRLTRYLSPVM